MSLYDEARKYILSGSSLDHDDVIENITNSGASEDHAEEVYKTIQSVDIYAL